MARPTRDRLQADDRRPDYCQLYDDLCEELTRQDDPAEVRLRALAREEADKRVSAWIAIGLGIGAIYAWGWWGLAAVAALVIAYSQYDDWLQARRPGGEPHLIADQAEDFVRLQIAAETHAAGQDFWRLKPKPYEGAQREVHAEDSVRWEDADERIYRTAVEFRRLSPLARQKRLRAAARLAESALRQGDAMAKASDAKLVFWAVRALSMLERGR